MGAKDRAKRCHAKCAAYPQVYMMVRSPIAMPIATTNGAKKIMATTSPIRGDCRCQRRATRWLAPSAKAFRDAELGIRRQQSSRPYERAVPDGICPPSFIVPRHESSRLSPHMIVSKLDQLSQRVLRSGRLARVHARWPPLECGFQRQWRPGRIAT